MRFDQTSRAARAGIALALIAIAAAANAAAAPLPAVDAKAGDPDAACFNGELAYSIAVEKAPSGMSDEARQKMGDEVTRVMSFFIGRLNKRFEPAQAGEQAGLAATAYDTAILGKDRFKLVASCMKYFNESSARIEGQLDPALELAKQRDAEIAFEALDTDALCIVMVSGPMPRLRTAAAQDPAARKGLNTLMFTQSYYMGRASAANDPGLLKDRLADAWRYLRGLAAKRDSATANARTSACVDGYVAALDVAFDGAVKGTKAGEAKN